MVRKQFSKQAAVRGPYHQTLSALDEYTDFENWLVIIAFVFGVGALIVFYALDDIYGSSKVVGVPYIAEPGVRYELTPPHIQRQLKEFLYAL